LACENTVAALRATDELLAQMFDQLWLKKSVSFDGSRDTSSVSSSAKVRFSMWFTSSPR
jgi:hypothetical protein